MRRYFSGKEFWALGIGVLPFFLLGFTNGWYGPELMRLGRGWFWLVDFVQFVVIPGTALLLLWKFWGIGPGKLGFHLDVPTKNPRELVWFAIVATVLFWISYDILGSFFASFASATNGEVLFAPALPKEQPLRFLVVLYATTTAALVEEAIFRAIPWMYCKAKLKSPGRPYMWMSSIAFAAIHWEQGFGYTMGAFFLGMIAAAIYVEIENVWPLVCAHFLSGCWHYKWL